MQIRLTYSERVRGCARVYSVRSTRCEGDGPRVRGERHCSYERATSRRRDVRPRSPPSHDPERHTEGHRRTHRDTERHTGEPHRPLVINERVVFVPGES
ncbi:unnamed protein product [Danaus chrysippus]|uniref:(African queen) hypothetical protein n=1 Tax=Danaus chrysippus TaxID=151541 RepID=A0A8J2WB35_9NEOP|nr:unnamed protein product [Danaus chrysippus]